MKKLNNQILDTEHKLFRNKLKKQLIMKRIKTLNERKLELENQLLQKQYTISKNNLKKQYITRRLNLLIERKFELEKQLETLNELTGLLNQTNEILRDIRGIRK
jgi:hypothetical protein